MLACSIPTEVSSIPVPSSEKAGISWHSAVHVQSGTLHRQRPHEKYPGILKDMLKILYPNIETVAQVRKSVKETINYYMNEYPQERFHGLTASEVREAVKSNR